MSSKTSTANDHGAPVAEEIWVPPTPETPGNRFWRKAKENPFVPLGMSCVFFVY